MQLQSVKEITMPHRMDSIISKGAGKVKGVIARLDGLVGVFKTLAGQHGEVVALMKKLQDKPEKKSELWPDIRRELLSHERGELREVYPVLRLRPETADLADQHALEASELEGLIDQIDAAADRGWTLIFDDLVEAVTQHAEEEEKRIFPKAQKVIGDKMARELEPKFLAAKKQAAAAV